MERHPLPVLSVLALTLAVPAPVTAGLHDDAQLQLDVRRFQWDAHGSDSYR